MKDRGFSLSVFVLVLSLSVLAQRSPIAGVPPADANANRPHSPGSTEAMFLSGKVAVDDGTPMTDAALIQSICKGAVRDEGYTDSKGGFTISLGSARGLVGSVQQSGAGVAGSGLRPNSRDMRECDLRAVLPGFSSNTVQLSKKGLDLGSSDVGTVVLHRLSQVEGFTVSATSAQAPEKARKSFEKGRESEHKEKWDEARKKFTEAVELYPRYAVAWLELGRTELHENNVAAARSAFHHAAQADAKFISPYQELAQLALKERQWPELVSTTEQVLKLNPVSFPQYWFLNGLGSYFLQSFDNAEKSVRQGLLVDGQHEFPKMEYLLGMILVQKHDYQGALAHVRNYIQLAPKASDLETAQKQIAELERLSAAAGSQSK
ncbi:MAG: tetratricopeptide repeat protein [Terriglobales bacterium]